MDVRCRSCEPECGIRVFLRSPDECIPAFALPWYEEVLGFGNSSIESDAKSLTFFFFFFDNMKCGRRTVKS